MIGVNIPGKIGLPMSATKGSLLGNIWSIGTMLCSGMNSSFYMIFIPKRVFSCLKIAKNTAKGKIFL
ncbi:MAG: hypothetical protein FWG29_11020 [Treponema sp.]|nr:hypothetical protein [Treponema sp.]